MVRALREEQEEDYRSRLYHFKGMNENAGGQHVKSLSADDSSSFEEYSSMEDRMTCRNHQAPRRLNDQASDHKQKVGTSPYRNDKGPRSRIGKDEAGVAPSGKDNKNLGKSNFLSSCTNILFHRLIMYYQIQCIIFSCLVKGKSLKDSYCLHLFDFGN
jgi:hypothetical protein